MWNKRRTHEQQCENVTFHVRVIVDFSVLSGALSSARTLPVPMLLAHTCTQHPPHTPAHHAHMHSGTLVS